MASLVLSPVGGKSEAANSHPGVPLLEFHCMFTGDGNGDNLFLTGHQKQCWI